METKNPNNDRDDEKTIIYSSAGKVSSNEASDKTIISNEAEKTQIQVTPQATSEKVEPPKAETEESTSVSEKKTVLKNENKISTGAFVAGVAGAGIAGADLGAVFSDDIKEVYAVLSDEAHDLLGADAP